MISEIKNQPVKDNNILHVIYERRAVRKYKNVLVDNNIINTVLDAGRMAPSAMNRQPWKFYVLTHKETIHAFSKEIVKVGFKNIIKAKPKQILKTVAGLLHFTFGPGILKHGDPVFYDAPVVVFITASKDNEWASLDIGMCCQNIMLCAKSLGLDSCPVGFAKLAEQTNIYYKLHIPANEQLHLAIILGYGDENPEAQKRIINNAFFINTQETLAK